jgi:hypothetical protein
MVEKGCPKNIILKLLREDDKIFKTIRRKGIKI